VRAICDRHEVLLVADEVLTGAGRTGTWSALEPYGVAPDIMILGKGIAGGYAPLSAVVAPRRIVDVLARGSGSFLHAQTFSHHPTLCAAGVATIRYLRKHHLIERCNKMGRVLHQQLQRLKRFSCVGDVRGRGLLAGIEFVREPSTREPFPSAMKVADTFARTALELGVVVWPNAGQLEDGTGDLVMLAPPFVITEEQIEAMVSILEQTAERTLERFEAAR
jgi:adenosylmethionine-8-amino-7-oxononanoate aminotransferase